MNHVEEQRNELEALSEIYYNEIKVISNTPPISFSINVRPQASNIDEFAVANDSDGEDADSDEEVDSEEDSDGESAPQQQLQPGPCVELLFELPPKYPDEKPSIQILESQNLEEHELAGLLANLNQKAEESLGTVMVFMIVSDVVEWLITVSDREAEELELEKEKRQQEAEENDKKRFDGTPVTVQTFLAWKAKFDAEIIKNKLEQQKQQQQQAEQASSGRLTGREMFETDKALAESDLDFVEDLDQNQLEALMHNIEELDIENDEGDDFELHITDEDDEDDDDDYDDSDEEDEEEEEEEEKKSSKVPQKSSASKR